MPGDHQVRSTLTKLVWFATRPKHWGDLPALIRRHTLPDRRDVDVAEARREYERLAIDVGELAGHVAGFEMLSVEKAHPPAFATAQSNRRDFGRDAGPGYLDLIYSVS